MTRLARHLLALLALLFTTLASQAADPVRGATLYASSPGGGRQSCAACHGSSPLTSNIDKIYAGRNSTSRIQSAVSSNAGGMGYFSSYYSATDLADIAAYLGNSPSSLAFASTAVGSTSAVSTVTVKASTGTSLSSIAVSTSGDFTRSGGTCAATLGAGLSCTIGVVFSPTASGARSGTLAISHSGVATPVQITLSGTGTASTAPVASLSASNLAFPATTVGATSSAQQVMLSNTGNAALTLSAISSSSDFTVAGGTCVAGTSVAAGGSCSVSVSFTPTATGSRSGTLAISHNAGGGTSTVALSGTGTAAAAPVATLSASSLAFGSVTVGQASAAQTLTLTNTGNATLVLGTLSSPGTDFSLAGTCSSGASLAAGSSCTLTLAFTPTATGVRSATLSLPHNAAGSPSTVTLSGTGVAASPVASASPTSLSFSQVVGGTSAAQTVSISNTGTAALTLGTLSLSGIQASEFAVAGGGTCTASGVVPAGGSCSVQLNFTPAATGSRSAVLSITHNATGSPLQVTLNGTGTAAPQGTLSVNASSLGFGSVVVGSSAAAQTVTVSNTGSAALTLQALALSGTAAADFTLGGSCVAGSTLAAGASCGLAVGFSPAAVGSRTSTLTLTSTASNPSAAISLAGTGTAAPTPVVALSPSSLAFGNQTVGATSAQRAVTLSNTGSGALAISAIATTAPFALSHDCGSSLAAGSSCSIWLTFHPTALGAASASLVVASNAAGSPHAVALTGTGVAAPPVLSWQGATTLDWGSVTVGSSAPVLSRVLANAGPGSATLQALTLGGAQAAEFSLASGNTCVAGAVLAAGASCTLALGFAPQAAGSRVATLSLASDGSAPGDLSLTGTGVAVAAPALSTSATALSFASDGSSGAQTLTISNSGAAELLVSSVQVASGPFSTAAAASNGCADTPFTLLPGQSCAIAITWTSSTDSADTGTLTLATNASAMPLQLALSAQRASVTVTASNVGGGGCTVAPDGPMDPLFPALLLSAVVVLAWRSRQALAARANR